MYKDDSSVMICNILGIVIAMLGSIIESVSVQNGMILLSCLEHMTGIQYAAESGNSCWIIHMLFCHMFLCIARIHIMFPINALFICYLAFK